MERDFRRWKEARKEKKKDKVEGWNIPIVVESKLVCSAFSV